MRKLFASVFALATALVGASEPLNVLVPIDWTGEPKEVMVKELRNMHDRYGLRKFVLIGPWCKQYYKGTDISDWEKLGDSIAYAKRELADLDVEIGWWIVPTISGGKYRPFQCLMDCDGNKTYASCPLDEGYVKDFKAKIVACASRARPSIIFFEDDYTLSNHGGMNAMKGCFCPLHLSEYAKRTGREWTAKEIAEMFRKPTAENAPLRSQFAMLSRGSLEGLAKSLRSAIDSVDPSIRVCLCQSGFVDIDGDSTETLVRAFAGKTRPMVRIFGAAYYNENAPTTLPGELAHTFWSAQHLPKDFELIHETDPYPHTRFYNSSLYLISELSGAIMAGVTGSYYYCTQYSDDPMGDDGYARRLVGFRRKLEVVRDLRSTMRPCGVRAVYTPKEVYMVRETTKSASSGMLPVHAYFLGKMGLPMTTLEEAPVAMLLGPTANQLSDGELRSLLAGGILIDAEAALILSRRGFSSLMGCEAVDQPAEMLYKYEAIEPVAGCKCRGKKLYNRKTESLHYIGWSPKKSALAKLTPVDGAQTWSALYDLDGKYVAPATVYYRNSLGGRVAVLSRSLDAKAHPSIYSPRKQEMFHNLFAKLAGEQEIDVTAPNTPSTWLISAKNEKELLVMAENLCGEPRSDFKLRFASKWHGGTVSHLQDDGTWKTIGKASAAFAVSEAILQPLLPQFFKVLVR